MRYRLAPAVSSQVTHVGILMFICGEQCVWSDHL